MTPFCASCGTKTESDWNSCPECGSKLSEQKLDGGSQPAVPKQPQQPQTSQYRPAYNPYQKPTTYPQGQTTYPRSQGTYPRSQTAYPSTNGFGIASLICALIGLCFMGWIFGIIAIILGGIGKTRDYNPGVAVAGIVIGIIDLCCGIFNFVYILPFLFYLL